MELNPELSYSFGLYGKGYHFDIYTYAKQFSCAQLLFQTGHNPLSLKLPRDPLKLYNSYVVVLSESEGPP